MHAKQLIPILYKHLNDPVLRRKSIFIEGASGIGKSQIMQALRDATGVEMRDKRLSQMDAVDLVGTPSTADGYTRWNPPDWMRFDPNSKGILLMEEITSASREVFAASYQLFLDRELNGAQIPEGWLVVALGNRLSDRGVVNQVPSPLLNRFVKLTLEPHLDSWVEWAGAAGVDPRMIAWVSYQPEYLHNFEAVGGGVSEPFCSPRSIVSASDYIDWPDEDRVEMLRGCLGKAGASALESYLRLYTQLPTKDEILADPIGCRIPGNDKLGERYAVTMLCSSVMDRISFEKLWQYVDRLGANFAMLAVKLAASRDKQILTAKGYREFTLKHNAVFAR